MSAEAVKVAVRCRPLNNREKFLNCKDVISIIPHRGQCSISNPSRDKDPPKTFFFDGAFDLNSTTEQIYADIVYPLVEGVTEGYNSTIFAYGQTGSGKTFTMQGVPGDLPNKGIISRSFEHLFETIATSSDVKYLVRVSFLEIYNEELRDLLEKESRVKCELKEHPEKGVFVMGLSMHKVKCVEDCKVIMEQGLKNRHVGSTLMNTDSSRSHSIFTVYLEMVSTDESTGIEHLKAGKLNLVDLAGSERQSKSGATGDRFKEATKINLSLSALGNVISALVDANARHVPYRDSKLTRLLQNSLGGNTKTLIIACLSPADNNYDETLSTLRYANRAKNIKNRPIINEDPKDALLRQYQEEITRLKAILNGKVEPNESIQPSLMETDEFIREKRKIEEDYERRLWEKEAQYMKEVANRAKLEEDILKLKDRLDKKLKRLEEKYRGRSLSIGDEDTNDLDGGICDGSLSSRTYSLSDSMVELPAYLHDSMTQDNYKPSREELLQKLHLLEADMLGGEEANNSEVRERRSRRRRHAEERLRVLAETNASLNEGADDDGIMLSIYESISDELRHKSKLLEREEQKTNSLEIEIGDLQREFEVDRQDYLETIRKQNQQINLLQAILDKVQPCIRKDSNYSNLDKIKKQARYDEETNNWIIPPLTTEPTVLPLSVNLNNRSVSSSQSHPSTRGFEAAKEEEMQLYAKLSSRSQNHIKYLKNNRMEKLLLDADQSKIIVLGKSQYLCTRPASSGNCLSFGSSPPSLSGSQVVVPVTLLEPTVPTESLLDQRFSARIENTGLCAIAHLVPLVSSQERIIHDFLL
nr:kinesin family 7 [Hymenolepis microstoma]